ncbi:MAG TPA: septal ring lytic transglycosylase RlpA family protein [Kofleriaceae bacterium]|nr:septal ring lytic transglycosylase RlpA family protein [Kofleriaceae bacterium]
MRTTGVGRRASIGILIAIALATIAACGARQQPPPTHPANVYRGMASWYGEAQMTASGERFDKHAMTAAHRTLPLGTRVRVTNQRNGRSVVVRINDRGPYAHGRIIDLSEAAARVLGMIEAGVAPVELEVLGR